METTLEKVYDEVRRVNSRLDFLERAFEELILRELSSVKLSNTDLTHIKRSVVEMRKGDYVPLRQLKRADRPL